MGDGQSRVLSPAGGGTDAVGAAKGRQPGRTVPDGPVRRGAGPGAGLDAAGAGGGGRAGYHGGAGPVRRPVAARLR